MNKDRKELQETLNKFKGKKLTNINVGEFWLNFEFDDKELLGIMDVKSEEKKLEKIRAILDESVQL